MNVIALTTSLCVVFPLYSVAQITSRQGCERTTDLLYQKFEDYSEFLQQRFTTSFNTTFDPRDLAVGYKTMVRLPVRISSPDMREMGFGNTVILSYGNKHGPIYLRYLSQNGTFGYYVGISSQQFMDALYNCKKINDKRKPCKNTRPRNPK